jgi:hypothetical protein
MIKPQSTFLRKILKFIGKVIAVFVLFMFILVIYAELKVRWVKKQVEAFSGLVIIGQPVTGLEYKAKEMHLKYRSITDSNGNDGSFHVWEGAFFNRWFCDVEFKDGKAINKKVAFVD